jgi:hypothetical protein
MASLMRVSRQLTAMAEGRCRHHPDLRVWDLAKKSHNGISAEEPFRISLWLFNTGGKSETSASLCSFG